MTTIPRAIVTVTLAAVGVLASGCPDSDMQTAPRSRPHASTPAGAALQITAATASPTPKFGPAPPTRTPTRTATPLPSSTPTPTVTGDLVFASGRVIVWGPRLISPATGEGTVVTVQGGPVLVSVTAGEQGYFTLPPFQANIPIVLTCSKQGYITVRKNPPGIYAPPPGIYTDWGCTILDRRIPP